MNAQPIFLNIPQPLYGRLKERATQNQRTVEQESLNALAAHVAATESLPDDLESELSALHLLDDESLWQAARSHFAPELAGQLEALHFKQQSEGLTEEESQTTAALVREYERAMLVRAQAAALLRQRGHNVDCLLQK